MKLFIINISLLFLFHSIVSSQSFKTDLKTMSKNADAIVAAEVTAINSVWGKDKSRIYTDVTLAINERIKGDKQGGSIVVRHLGGEVDGVGELYSHMPKFSEKEEVLLFVKEAADSRYEVLNGEEGKIQIITNETSGVKTTAMNKSLKSFKTQIKNYLEQ